MVMKTYMASDGCPENGAVLVFAHDVKEAKKVGWPAVTSWRPDAEYIDLRVVLLKDKPFLFDNANPELLKAGKAHANDNPKACSNCEMWGNKLNEHGICDSCTDEEEPN